MEKKTYYPPREPNKPKLSTIKKYTFFDFILIGIHILIFTFFCRGLDYKLESQRVFFGIITIYLAIRLWPLVVTNNLNRVKNSKLMKSYKVEMTKYVKSYQEYRIERDRSDAAELKIKLELDRAKKAERPQISDIELQDRLKQLREKARLPNDSSGSITKDGNIEIEVTNTIRKYSAICAAMAVQPIPFADIFILTPTQIIMGKKIASLRGYEVKDSSIEKILKEISGIIGMGVLAQQVVIGAYKTFLPFMGGITTIPVVYGLTYGIGKTMDYYIVAKINGKQINKSEVERIFKNSREFGQREGKSKENDISRSSKK
jgi:uncharacterized protein (DUF697 family)